ncbi:MAG: S-layer homology domain-containing protein, partial [Ignavibacteriae bacterium]|nr:S-layer homology domain-containing protein [Ignavibacteriota bacterium]
EIWGTGEFGSYGISLGNGKIAFGLHNGQEGTTLCGNTYVADNLWHHVAVTRRESTGEMRIYVDGKLDSNIYGPRGDISYNFGGGTGGGTGLYYMVIGASKLGVENENYPSYNGYFDELRFSNSVRYTQNFTPTNIPFLTDDYTMGLYHFDEGTGIEVVDTAYVVSSPSNGFLSVGGNPAGPLWTTQTPILPTSDDTGSSGGITTGGGGGGGGGGSSTTTGTTQTQTFPDVPPNHTFYNYIETLAKYKVVSGYSDGYFRPDDTVTRGQMAKFVANGFGFIKVDESCKRFPDVNKNSVFYDYIITLKCKGIVTGYSDGYFKPEEPVTRGQAMKFVINGARTAKGDPLFLPKSGVNPFPDLPSSNTFHEYVLSAYSNSIISGFSDGTFKPEDTVTRGAMSKMVSNTRDKLLE